MEEGVEYSIECRSHSHFDDATAMGYENWINNQESAVIVETRDAWELGIRH